MAWGWQRFGVGDPGITFKAIPGLAAWRLATTGAVSGARAADAVFLGIGADAVTPLPPEDLCDRLYTNPAPGLPVAVFTDINCPNCRSLEAKLAAREDHHSITWLQLPLLGPASEAAALVALAAEQISGLPAVPPHGIRGVGIASIVRFHAKRTGLDPRLLNDASFQPAVKARLHDHARVAETLGIWGTPAMTIGKTLVMGDLSEQRLDRLLQMDHPDCGKGR